MPNKLIIVSKGAVLFFPEMLALVELKYTFSAMAWLSTQELFMKKL